MPAPARSGGAGEGHQHRLPCVARDLQHVAGAEIVHRDHRAEERVVLQHGGQSDEIGMVELVLAGRRQRRARQIKEKAAQPLGPVAVGDAGERGDHHAVALGLADDAQREAPRAALVLQRTITRDRVGRVGETLDPHRAAHPVRRPDDAETDAASGHLTNEFVFPAHAGIQGTRRSRCPGCPRARGRRGRRDRGHIAHLS
jgi:hypothetical protein